MEEAKISLSPSEFELVTNAEIILTKNRVLQTIQNELGHLGNLEQDHAQKMHYSQLPEFGTGPKISKGENYLGLPYIILDYPRYSTTSDFFFIRHLFWWGRLFSTTLQVKGKYSELLYRGIHQNNLRQEQSGYFIGINQDPWKHHFEDDNYQPLHTMGQNKLDRLFSEQEYIKIAKSWALDEYDKINYLFFETWKYLLNISSLIT